MVADTVVSRRNHARRNERSEQWVGMVKTWCQIKPQHQTQKHEVWNRGELCSTTITHANAEGSWVGLTQPQTLPGSVRFSKGWRLSGGWGLGGERGYAKIFVY